MSEEFSPCCHSKELRPWRKRLVTFLLAVCRCRQALGVTVEINSITEAEVQSGFPLSLLHKSSWPCQTQEVAPATPACPAGHGVGSVERRELSAGKPLLRMAERLWDRRFLEASVWHSMLISLGLSEALSPKFLKVAVCNLLESSVWSPKQLGSRHFSLEHKIR